MIKSLAIITLYIAVILVLLQIAILLIPPTCSPEVEYCVIEKIENHFWITRNTNESFLAYNLIVKNTSYTFEIDYDVVP